MKFLAALLLLIPASAETLHYIISWPSGLSLGEATLISDRGAEQLGFDLTVDASVPGFSARDHVHSTATPDFCSLSLEKTMAHGQRKTAETDSFDPKTGKVTREGAKGGGKSELQLSACARDALTFIAFARRELAQGRLVPQQQVVFGGPYQVRMEFTGAQAVKVGEEQIDSDRIVATVKGPASDLTIEMFFARDPARTPVLAHVPVAVGTLTVERVR